MNTVGQHSCTALRVVREPQNRSLPFPSWWNMLFFWFKNIFKKYSCVSNACESELSVRRGEEGELSGEAWMDCPSLTDDVHWSYRRGPGVGSRLTFCFRGFRGRRSRVQQIGGDATRQGGAFQRAEVSPRLVDITTWAINKNISHIWHSKNTNIPERNKHLLKNTQIHDTLFFYVTVCICDPSRAETISNKKTLSLI